MRGVSRWFRRSAVLLVLLSMFTAHAAVAAERETGRSLNDRFEQARRFIVVIFSRFGWPPGSEFFIVSQSVRSPVRSATVEEG